MHQDTNGLCVCVCVCVWICANIMPEGASLIVPHKLEQSFLENYPCGRDTGRCNWGDVYRTHHLNVGSVELSLRGLANIWMQGVTAVLRRSLSIEYWNRVVHTMSLMSPGYWPQLLSKTLPAFTSVETARQCLLSCSSLQARMKLERFPSRHTLPQFFHNIVWVSLFNWKWADIEINKGFFT